ncbi:MAG: hypothetical protein ACYSVY_27595 [Planctomycetota bacterium]|jgi:hypothetical protein
MANFDGQNTDGENNKALAKATPVEDDVKTKALGSAQAIAQTKKNLGGLDATGNEDPVTASAQAGK